MQVGQLEMGAGTRDRRGRRTGVVVLYKHRLFRDIVTGLMVRHPGIASVESTRSGENGLRLIDDFSADKVVLVVETEARISLDRGTLSFLLRATEGDPRIRVLAITLAGSGILFDRWRWLRHLDLDGLMQGILDD